MSLRDYFAAKAIQGICANESWNGNFRQTAEDAFIVADAMLREREKETP